MTRRLAAVPDAPRRAIALIRVSSSMGRGDDLTSPALQRQAIESYAAASGLVVVEWVEAVDESGSSGKSPWWRRLDKAVERVEVGDAEAILVWKFSRAARNRRRWAIALDRVEVAGGVIESATEQLDTSTSTGRLARGMLAELAAWEAEVRGEGWKETHARRNREGLPHNGAKRLGYEVIGKRYEPHPVEGPLLAEAFERYLRGESHRHILEWLTALGIVNRITGRPWTVRGFRVSMDSGFAAGQIHHGGHSGIPDRWEPGAQAPLITPETWDQYQRARRARGANGVTRRQQQPSHPLTGIVRCSACKKAMACKKPSAAVLAGMDGSRGSPIQAGEPYLFSCYTPECVDRHSATVARVDQAFTDWLRPHVTEIERSAEAAAADHAKRTVVTVDLAHFRREQKRISEQRLDLIRDHNAKLYDTESFLVIRAELDAASDAIRQQLDQLSAVLDRPRPTPAFFGNLIARWDFLDLMGQRQIVRDLGLQVRVFRAEGKRGRNSSVVRCKGGWDQTPW